jgi:very-short-patch-repair endonuclease
MSEIDNVTRRRSRELRNAATPPEHRLWQYLRILNRGGLNFPRQAPIGKFIADFAEYSRRLVIELDGDSHANVAAAGYDAKRDEFLQRQGFRVLRVANRDVLTNPEGVVASIMQAIETWEPGHDA